MKIVVLVLVKRFTNIFFCNRLFAAEKWPFFNENVFLQRLTYVANMLLASKSKFIGKNFICDDDFLRKCIIAMNNVGRKNLFQRVKFFKIFFLSFKLICGNKRSPQKLYFNDTYPLGIPNGDDNS